MAVPSSKVFEFQRRIETVLKEEFKKWLLKNLKEKWLVEEIGRELIAEKEVGRVLEEKLRQALTCEHVKKLIEKYTDKVFKECVVEKATPIGKLSECVFEVLDRLRDEILRKIDEALVECGLVGRK